MNIALTASSQHLSPWYRTGAFNDVAPSATLGPQSLSWRKLDTAGTSSSSTSSRRFWSSPWNKTELNSPSDYSSPPWGQNNTTSPGQVYIPPWKRLNMSNSPRKSTRACSSERSGLKCVATPTHGELRPRLHLTIPNQSAGVNIIESFLKNVAQKDAHGVTGVAAHAVVPQQAVHGSLTSPPTVETQAPYEEVQTPTMRRPHVFNANASEFLHSGTPIPEEVDGFIIGPRMPPRTESVSGGISSPRTDCSTLASPSKESLLPLGQPSLAAKESHPHLMGTLSNSSQAAIDSPDEAAQASHAEGSDRPGPARCPSGPRMTGGRFPHTNPRTREPSHLIIPNRPRSDVSHTNSRTWVNPKTKLQERWAEVYRNLKEMSLIKEYRSERSSAPPPVGGSFCVPTTFNEWNEHRLEFANDRTKQARRRLARMEHQYSRPRHEDLPSAGPTAPITVSPFGGKKFRDGLSAVLCMATIWTTWKPCKERQTWSWFREEPSREEQIAEERPEAMWPTEEEMREEGNERMTSGFRRFPALPRVPGNPTVNWKQKKALAQLPFDEVWKLPSAESFDAQHEMTDTDEMRAMEEWIGHDLVTAVAYEIWDED